MARQPKGIKGMRRKLRDSKQITAIAIKQAMHEASKALDRQAQEIVAMRRILISERAQVIYYTEKYRAMVARECLDAVAIGFLGLTEAQQEPFVKQSIRELNGEASIVPHDPEAVASQQEMQDTAKKIRLN